MVHNIAAEACELEYTLWVETCVWCLPTRRVVIPPIKLPSEVNARTMSSSEYRYASRLNTCAKFHSSWSVYGGEGSDGAKDPSTKSLCQLKVVAAGHALSPNPMSCQLADRPHTFLKCVPIKAHQTLFSAPTTTSSSTADAVSRCRF